jgi:prolyl-tRNA synthetase
LSHDLQYQTKLQSSKDATVPVPFSNEEADLSSPVELLGVLKDQDNSVVATSPQPNDQVVLSTNTVSDSGAVSSGNISSSVPVQLVPVLKDTTGVSQSRMEESIYALPAKDAVAEEQPVMSEIALVDKSHKDYQQRQLSADINEQSRVVIQKIENGDEEDDDGDEWLKEEETGGLRSTTIPIANDEDVSFSDLEEDDDA